MINLRYITGNTINFYDFQLANAPAASNFLFHAKLKDYPFEKTFYCLNSSGQDEYYQFIVSISGGTEVLSGGTSGVNLHLSAGTYDLNVYSDTGNTYNYSAATFLGHDLLWVDPSLGANRYPPVAVIPPSNCLPVTVTDHLSAVTVSAGGSYSCVPFSSVTVLDALATGSTAVTLSEGVTYTCTQASPTSVIFRISGTTISESLGRKVLTYFPFSGTLESINLMGASTIQVLRGFTQVTTGATFLPNNRMEVAWTGGSTGIELSFNVTTNTVNNMFGNMYSVHDFSQFQNATTSDIVIPYNLTGHQTHTCIKPTLTSNTGTFNIVAISRKGFDRGSLWSPIATSQHEFFGFTTANTMSIPGTGYNILKYGIYVNGFALQTVQSGTLANNFNLQNAGSGVSFYTTMVRILDSGTDIQYQYSVDSGNIWTTWHTSTLPYVSGEIHYPASIISNGIANVGGPLLIQTNGFF